jgi:hypothetical protein
LNFGPSSKVTLSCLVMTIFDTMDIWEAQNKETIGNKEILNKLGLLICI